MTPSLLLSPSLAPPTRVDLLRSRDIAERLGALPKQCYHNAQRARRFVPDGTYVEGLVVIHSGLIFEHAWMESERGEVIEPTPSYLDDRAYPRNYFAGPAWDCPMLSQLLRARRSLGGGPLYSPHTATPQQEASWFRSQLATLRHLHAITATAPYAQSCAAHVEHVLNLRYDDDWMPRARAALLHDGR